MSAPTVCLCLLLLIGASGHLLRALVDEADVKLEPLPQAASWYFVQLSRTFILSLLLFHAQYAPVPPRSVEGVGVRTAMMFAAALTATSYPHAAAAVLLLYTHLGSESDYTSSTSRSIPSSAVQWLSVASTGLGICAVATEGWARESGEVGSRVLARTLFTALTAVILVWPSRRRLTPTHGRILHCTVILFSCLYQYHCAQRCLALSPSASSLLDVMWATRAAHWPAMMEAILIDVAIALHCLFSSRQRPGETWRWTHFCVVSLLLVAVPSAAILSAHALFTQWLEKRQVPRKG